MKTFLIIFILLCGCSISNAQTNPVIIELFTSQGCSSCPAADKNLTEILLRAKKEGRPVYGLSFHVDYWNYIGWKDPYSSKGFTARQRQYGEQMNLRSIYTPQMIVNGSQEFVGSNESESKSAVEVAMKQKPIYTISISNLTAANGKLSFHYSLDKMPNNEIINIAIVERETENYVPRGENSGRKLHHNNVVRSFVTNPSKQRQDVELNLPEMNLQKASIIVYLQNKEWQVVGAVAKELNL
jgi:hypothetical protein